MKFPYRNNSTDRGFTLIELLIVIVIIGILSGVLLSVINPADQQRRARETVLRSTTEKLCLGLMACAATSSNAATCDSWGEIGARDDFVDDVNGLPTIKNNGEPTTPPNQSLYDVITDNNVVAVVGALPRSSDTVTCYYGCAYDFGAATVDVDFSQLGVGDASSFSSEAIDIRSHAGFNTVTAADTEYCLVD